jgi:molybdopterin-guanine dinucleotide biosynthesis protein A
MLGGVSLLERAVARARLQVDALALSGSELFHNELPVISDSMPGQGPLAAVCSCLAWARERDYRFLATFPCDVPFFPDDIVVRLLQALEQGADCAMARRKGQGHYAFSLWPVSGLSKVQDAMARGLRSLRALAPILTAAYAEMPEGDGPGGDPFFNINRPDDLAAAEAWLSRNRSV